MQIDLPRNSCISNTLGGSPSFNEELFRFPQDIREGQVIVQLPDILERITEKAADNTLCEI